MKSWLIASVMFAFFGCSSSNNHNAQTEAMLIAATAADTHPEASSSAGTRLDAALQRGDSGGEDFALARGQAAACDADCEVTLFPILDSDLAPDGCVDTSSPVQACHCAEGLHPPPGGTCLQEIETGARYFGQTSPDFIAQSDRFGYCATDISAIVTCDAARTCTTPLPRVVCSSTAYCEEFASNTSLECGGEASLLDDDGCPRASCTGNADCAGDARCVEVTCNKVPDCIEQQGRCNCVSTNQPCQPQKVCIP